VTSAYAVRGAALHTPEPDRLEAWQDALIEVDGAGRIIALRDATVAAVAAYENSGRLTTLKPGQWLLPGLVDLQIHAPQWPQLGTALDLPLERWLQHYTFPLEARFADTVYAADVYESLVTALLANGTTTAVYFASRHLRATQILAETCLRRGQRALVGRVAMDHPAQCPDFYRDPSADVAEADTRALIRHIRALPGNTDGLVLPVITPRFIPACTDATLRRLGALAAEAGCHVQTHVSESDWEHTHVLQRCGCSDTEALQRFGLLTRRTILAHGNFLGDDDLSRIRAAGAGIAHCPLSNVYFANAVFPLRAALAKRVNVGLGTDIAGGASASLLESARMAISVSRMLDCGVDAARPPATRGCTGARIGAVQAFWLATAGGGIVLDLPLGQFRPGYVFDAMAIDPDVPASNLRLSPGDRPEQTLERIVHTASRANISQVWVSGRVVSGCRDANRAPGTVAGSAPAGR
jgi:guanine deaminase